jgi:hypothetical protein
MTTFRAEPAATRRSASAHLRACDGHKVWHGGTRISASGRVMQVFEKRKSNLTFYSNLGGTQVIGHLARWEGKHAAIYFFRDGPHAGKVASAFFPTQKQLSRIFGTMSRHGP